MYMKQNQFDKLYNIYLKLANPHITGYIPRADIANELGSILGELQTEHETFKRKTTNRVNAKRKINPKYGR